MSDFFGKNGTVIHGAMVLFFYDKSTMINVVTEEEKATMNTTKVNYFFRYYDCVTDDHTEDWFSVVSSLELVLTEVKKQFPLMEWATLQTDGATCYKSLPLYSALRALKETAGIAIDKHIFTESGTGKTALDCHFAYVTAWLNKYVDTDKSVTSAAEVKLALDSNGGIKGSFSIMYIPQRLPDPAHPLNACQGDAHSASALKFVYQSSHILEVQLMPDGGAKFLFFSGQSPMFIVSNANMDGIFKGQPQKHTGVQVGEGAKEVKKLSFTPECTAKAADRIRILQEKSDKKESRAISMQEKQKQETSVREAHSSGNSLLHRCNKTNNNGYRCRRVFVSKIWCDKHIAQEYHDWEADCQSLNQFAAENFDKFFSTSFNHGQTHSGKQIFVIKTTDVESMPPLQSYKNPALPGMCRKKNEKNHQKSVKLTTFLTNLFMAGVRNKGQKVSPRIALEQIKAAILEGNKTYMKD